MKCSGYIALLIALALAGCSADRKATGAQGSGFTGGIGDQVDLDGDGDFDGVAVDVDGDGKIDGVDTDGDGDVDAPLPTGNANGTTGNNGGTTTNGTTAASDGGGNFDCGRITIKTEATTPDILIVLDRSGSMNPGIGSATDRWSGSRDAIISSTARFDDLIRFGLMTFPEYTGEPDACAGLTGFDLLLCQFSSANVGDQCAQGTVNVDLGLNKAQEISDVLTPMNAAGGTPTAPTLATALTVIGAAEQGVLDGVAAVKYVLLITDGDPNCSSGGGGGGGAIDMQARTESIANITALADAGVRTYVVGFETAGTAFEGQMDMMAAAGDTGATTHTSVSSSAELETVLEQLIGAAVSCNYKLDKPVEDPRFVRVTLDDKTINYEAVAADGWSLGADKQTVTLNGASCDQLQQNVGTVLNVVVECYIVDIE